MTVKMQDLTAQEREICTLARQLEPQELADFLVIAAAMAAANCPEAPAEIKAIYDRYMTEAEAGTLTRDSIPQYAQEIRAVTQREV